VATGAGAMIVLLPLELITAFIVWFIVGKIFKISSLASLLALFLDFSNTRANLAKTKTSDTNYQDFPQSKINPNPTMGFNDFKER
ncbi:hypothetical protein VWM68_10965, partial [Campylobacter coli]